MSSHFRYPFIKDICLSASLVVVFPRCFHPAASVFCVLFSVVLMDTVVMLLSSPIICSIGLYVSTVLDYSSVCITSCYVSR
jgi:hypothetical protein